MSRLLAFLLLVFSSLCHGTPFADGFDHGSCAVTQRHNLGITIGPPAGGSDLKLTMAIEALPVRKGEALQGALIGQGGTAPYVYSIAGGSLPTGVTLNASTGILSGTPTTVGRYTFLAQVQDAALGVYKCTLSIQVIPALEIVAGSPPIGEATLDYAYQFQISGATGAVTYAVTSGSLPFPFNLTSGGLLSSSAPATTATASPVPLIVTATDAGSGDSIDIPFTLDIRFHLSASQSFSFPVSVEVSEAAAHAVTISTGVGPYRFTSISVPVWMTYEVTQYYIDNTVPNATSPQDYVRGRVEFFGIPPASSYPQASQSFNITFDLTDAFGETISVTVPTTITNAHALQPKLAGISTGNSGPLNWNFSSDFTVSNDGTTVDIDLATTPGTVNSVALSMPGIFSVAGSPITTSGTFTVTFQTQAANVVFAGPTTGSAAVPTFRSLVGADLPSASVTAQGALAANDYGALQALQHAALGGM